MQFMTEEAGKECLTEGELPFGLLPGSSMNQLQAVLRDCTRNLQNEATWNRRRRRPVIEFTDTETGRRVLLIHSYNGIEVNALHIDSPAQGDSPRHHTEINFYTGPNAPDVKAQVAFADIFEGSKDEDAYPIEQLRDMESGDEYKELCEALKLLQRKGGQ
jgi:hypothetical protein